MNKKVIIIGAGGHSKVISDIIKLSGDILVGYLDDSKSGTFCDGNIIGTTDDIGTHDCLYFVAIGNNEVRERLMKHGVRWYTAIHPSAVIASDVIIDEGTAIMANAVINSGSKIGRGVIINTAATVDHDNIINDFSHIGPGAHLAGTVHIGEKVWIGIGANIINDISICSGTVVGAGAVVIKNIVNNGTYIGVPAGRKK